MDFETLAKEQPPTTGAYVAFDTIGQRVEGKIVTVNVVRATAYQTNEPLSFPDGTEKYNVVVAVQTSERIDADDDGVRAIWTKWYGAQRGAWAQALAETKASSPLVGGYFACTYTGDLKGERGMSPTKLFKFEYRPPTAMTNLVEQQPVAAIAGAAPYGSVPVQGSTTTTLPEPSRQASPQPPKASTQPVPTGDLAAVFGSIKAAVSAGLTVDQIIMMMPTVDPAAIRAVAAAPAA